ncbi:hypothetical protein BDZ97DRAFT_1901917 [Flammula alnicola]|nr:hypothetical protein BDZ97DRAFT_1901917 [Flammula alnicola]
MPVSDHEQESQDSQSKSIHNDGKGIQLSVSFIGLLPPPKAGEKRRANAKPPVTTKVVYVHENSSFIQGLVKILWQSLQRKDLCQGGLDRHGNLREKTAAMFSLEYTIPRTQLKDIAMVSEDDWETFLEEAGKKPSAQVKLTIKEKLTPEAEAALKERAEESEDEDDGNSKSKKKKKKHVPTEEEINQDAIIKRLTEIHMCEDRKCTFAGPCWVDAENTAHIHLTHLHLRTWAAAIVRHLKSLTVFRLLT